MSIRAQQCTIIWILLLGACVHQPAFQRAEQIVNSSGMRFIWVSTGSARSGFYLGETEVTQEQWKQVMGDTPSFHSGRSFPVETVRWDDAVLFCKKLSKKDGKLYRLPTQNEWELAYKRDRIGNRKVSATENLLGQYSGNGTRRVAAGSSGACGFFDLEGNVEEWTSSEAPAVRIGPISLSERIVEGGSFLNQARPSSVPRTTSRLQGFASNRTGFRVVCELQD